MGTLLIRADASEKIGTGHVMRCLALAQAWKKRGGTVLLLSRALPKPLHTLVKKSGARLLALQGTKNEEKAIREVAAHFHSKWVVMDGYHFPNSLISKLSTSEDLSVLQIFDAPKPPRSGAQLLVNPNLHAKGMRAPSVKSHLLGGSRFALLREEFLTLPTRSLKESAQRLLVSFGGSDPENHTERALYALAGCNNLPRALKIRIIIGGANPHHTQLLTLVQKLELKAKVICNARNMKRHFAWADIGLLSASTVFLEACSTGLPCILVQTADNQAPILRAARTNGLAATLSVGRPWKGKAFRRSLEKLAAKTERRLLSEQSRLQVDGLGAERIVAAMQAMTFRLRVATSSDKKNLWVWANDSETRALSFDSKRIPYAAHCKWFQSKLQAPDSLILMAETQDGASFGVFRFEPLNGLTTISVNIAPTYRSLGFGAQLLTAATQRAAEVLAVSRVRALIKPENARSQRAFADAGYTKQPVTVSTHLVMDWKVKGGKS